MRLRRAAPSLLIVAVAVLLALTIAVPALAQVPPVPPAPPAPPPPPSLSQVIDSARNWLVALLASLARTYVRRVL